MFPVIPKAKKTAHFIKEEPKQEEASTSKEQENTTLKWKPKRIQPKASPIAPINEQKSKRAQPQKFNPASMYDPIKLARFGYGTMCLQCKATMVVLKSYGFLSHLHLVRKST